MKRVVVPVAIVVALALVPKFTIDIPYVFGGGMNTPGTLQLLALCLLFGGLALSYDLLFGFTGLLSFGHALYFAIGVYVAAIAMTRWHWSFWEAILFTAVVGFLVAVVLGAVSLRVGGIAFAMVTLAFAQAGSILVLKNPHGWTGGEEGFGVDYHQLPTWAVGILNTKNLYWLALGYAAAVFAIVRWAVNSSPGHVWQAIRENELRVQVLGLKPYTYKLMSFLLASMLATAGGVIYLLLLGGANTQVTTASFTLTLLLMVVLGGTGSRWGAMIGGILYTYADHRLGDLSSSGTVSSLPSDLPDAAAAAALHPRRAVHPGRVLRSRRPDPDRRGRCATGPDPAQARRAGGGPVKIAWESRGEGPPLLLIQGLGYGRWSWEPIVPGLAARHQVVFFDNRGIGESDKPKGPYTAAQMAGDALQVMDEAGIERAHVLGASLGGMIAQELAVAAPERVDRLVLACTTPGGPDHRADARGHAAAVCGGSVTRAGSGPAAVRRERARPEPADCARR